MWSEYFHDTVTWQKVSILLHNALDEGLESLELRLGYQHQAGQAEASSKHFKLCKIQMT